MARKERFALIMEDGAKVRNIDDFKAHFDIGSVVRDFCNGKLLTWLEDRYYDEEAAAIKKLSPDDYDFQKKLCEIFGKETPEEIERRIQRLNRLKQYTDNKKILSNVDKVAFDQEELADLLDEGVDEIYLCANRFVIPLRMKNKTYIGVCDAVATIGNNKPADFAKLGIKFKNVSFDNDSKKNPSKSTSKPKDNTPAEKPKKKTHNKAVEATTIIQNRNGICARPASGFVQKASSFKSKILIKAKGKIVDAKSIFMIMSLGLVKGVEITIVAEGSDAQEAVKALIEIVDNKFGVE